MKYLNLFALFVLAGAGIYAQEAPTPAKPPVAPTTARPALPPPMPARAVTEMLAAGSVKTVKGAPFAAEAVSESVQILADGNRITRSYSTRMFRDSEGRFRREGNSDPGAGSGFLTSGNFLTVYGGRDTISIFDPVENVRYSLDPEKKTVRRSVFKPFDVTTTVTVNGQTLTATAPIARAQIETGVRDGQVFTQIAPVTSIGGVTVVSSIGFNSKYETKSESLGSRSFDGAEAEGTRTVTTIPAGAIGNERPIEIVYERWYSKELQMIVFSKHYDPRFGEQTYRLNNISRSEQDRSLFSPPSDYKLVNEPAVNFYTTKPQ